MRRQQFIEPWDGPNKWASVACCAVALLRFLPSGAPNLVSTRKLLDHPVKGLKPGEWRYAGGCKQYLKSAVEARVISYTKRPRRRAKSSGGHTGSGLGNREPSQQAAG